MLKLLARDGWVVYRHHGGSHRQLKHPIKPGKVTVAGKESLDLHPDTLRSILRQAGIELRK